MTRKLESLFDLPASMSDELTDPVIQPQNNLESLPDTLAALDKIESALPAVRGLESSDAEMDELANMAVKEFNNLLDLGMNVDSRYASEIFGVASQMLGHAITAKTAKVNKKLRMIDLQLKKAKLDQDTNKEAALPVGQGTVLDRNELLASLLKRNETDTPKK
jgi:hypothetical protein